MIKRYFTNPHTTEVFIFGNPSQSLRFKNLTYKAPGRESRTRALSRIILNTIHLLRIDVQCDRFIMKFIVFVILRECCIRADMESSRHDAGEPSGFSIKTFSSKKENIRKITECGWVERHPNWINYSFTHFFDSVVSSNQRNRKLLRQASIHWYFKHWLNFRLEINHTVQLSETSWDTSSRTT